ncbi:TMEM128 [Cervus elaphus hippelaphus]|uniref:TMEM128 n=1 Tax=Cervus elaphus hippelaphus TaxID=46360 RepID=A0A212D6U5_CEREH|nr:TMEM128 [Cervus elaphus hippelaphus]
MRTAETRRVPDAESGKQPSTKAGTYSPARAHPRAPDVATGSSGDVNVTSVPFLGGTKMDALRAREQLRRRYLFPPDAEVSLEREGYSSPDLAVSLCPARADEASSHTLSQVLDGVGRRRKPLPLGGVLGDSLGTWFLVGSALLLVSVSIAFYCIVYLEWYHGIEDYDIKYPALIPITTATFIIAGICFNVALWHVWSFFTPLLLFTQFMGVVMLTSLLG